jgi:hypothetical protein
LVISGQAADQIQRLKRRNTTANDEKNAFAAQHAGFCPKSHRECVET